MPITSNRLFLAWAEKHKEAIQLEVDLAAAGADTAGAMRQRLAAVQQEAQSLLAQAQAAFHAEMVARGLGDGGFRLDSASPGNPP